ncbi:MAG: hypothetical protein QG591_89 [Planctomycetota bacterium]|nr:hypothetical protein [Planctomycetota bacterium]
MKTKQLADTMINMAKPYYSEELDRAADAVIDSISNVIDPIETSGRVALASLLRSVASGEMVGNASYNFLSALAQKKTPNPVQKIEEYQKVDMRMVISDLVASSPSILEEMKTKALEARLEIRERLRIADGLPLHVLPSDKSNEVISALPPESEELKKLRDGSVGIE